MQKNILKILLITFIILIAISFFAFDLNQLLNLNLIKEQQNNFVSYYLENKVLVISVFFIVYVFVTAFSIPAATFLTLLAGALFGFLHGLILVSFASTIGATLAFLMARFILHDLVQEKYGKYLEKVNEGFKKEGAFYLFTLRLVPLFPFFVINIVMSLVPIRTIVFYLVSQIGMLPGTAVYVFAGTELSKINQISDIASPRLLIAFTLLGLFPIITKKILKYLRNKNGEI